MLYGDHTKEPYVTGSTLLNNNLSLTYLEPVPWLFFISQWGQTYMSPANLRGSFQSGRREPCRSQLCQGIVPGRGLARGVTFRTVLRASGETVALQEALREAEGSLTGGRLILF